ncbi:MAG: hypothetical protein UV74_C0013G0301 [Candidatus Woesebacteria bacterium GW2011_GWB1_43_14]|uniref:O-antigen ligase-related domain-containing protein n=1 Tax=Candidatus Woesebacteria bacterium GW2011_GWB1_43_14 TaxID=1618578 RepID=A0A0G1DHM1_9BACT|nr:MAG: hypothetical protein UT21_C0001G0011 [Candidatus Woesebacteria bacterium GW2011_GWA1_39_11b]KKS78404.1 MAG: hypothetical protein UV51_C0001G0120 [Candidatus Woesebacteria bacterium GW2011_GWC1_42_9]KKS97179.1 MAG: hypothetical protein UV74_C0013G0301 [Candidatus Woesebacteria bacterium GW2011_GWB1_43_14]
MQFLEEVHFQKHMQKRLSRYRKIIDSNIKFGLAALILVVPLYPKFPFLNIPGTQVAIRLEDLLIFIVLALWLFCSVEKIPKFMNNKIIIAFVLFWSISLVSTFSGVFITQTVSAHISFLHWMRRVEYMFGFIIALDVIKKRGDLAFYLKLLTIDLFIIFLFGLGQKYLNWPVITTQNAEYAKGVALRYIPGSHLISTFAGHYDLATYIVLMAPIFIVLSFGTRNVVDSVKIIKNSLVAKGIFLFISTISLWTLVNSASRISIASYLGSVTLALIFIKKYRYIPVVIVASILFISSSSNLIDRYMRIIEVTVQKVVGERGNIVELDLVYAAEDAPARRETKIPTPTPVPVFEDRSTSIRINVEWPRALRALKKNLILGTGYSSITLATDNDYLRMLGEIGILGTLSFSLVLAKIVYYLFAELLRHGSKPSLERYFVLAVLAAVPGVMLNMVFIDILEASKFAIMFWIILGLAISSANLLSNEKD